MTVQEVIDALIALGPLASDMPVIISGDGVFEAEVQTVELDVDVVVAGASG